LGGDTASKKAAKNGEPNHQGRRRVKGHYPAGIKQGGTSGTAGKAEPHQQCKEECRALLEKQCHINNAAGLLFLCGTWHQRPVTPQVDYFWEGTQHQRRLLKMGNQITNAAGASKATTPAGIKQGGTLCTAGKAEPNQQWNRLIVFWGHGIIGEYPCRLIIFGGMWHWRRLLEPNHQHSRLIGFFWDVVSKATNN